jgi:tripartite-type tricarboxylate transporter receptor subunit TctC
MTTTSRHRLLFAAASVAAVAAATAAPAQDNTIDYPVDTVRLITHSSPGGGGDVLLRDILPYLTEMMPDVTFIVENVVGGSSATALAELAQGPNDGSLIYTTTPTFIYTSLLSDLDFDHEDVDGLVNMFFDPQVLFTRADSPLNTFDDVLAAAREGGQVWGAASPGSLERIKLEQLKQITEVDVAIATTEGGGETMLNVLNGTFDLALGELLEITSQIEAGELKLIAFFTEDRIETYPDVPTLSESGIDLVIEKFRGFASPPDLAPEAIAAWEQIVPRLLEEPAYVEHYSASNLQPAFMPHEETEAFLEAFTEETASSLSALGLIQE